MSRISDFSHVHRKPDRVSTDRALLDALLDEVHLGTLSTVVATADGPEPLVVPTLFVRDGDRLLTHGSTGAGALRAVAEGAPVAVCVAALDGWVVADSLFDSSANYRSAVVRGRVRTLRGEEAAAAAVAVGDGLLPGRSAEVRAVSRKELAATLFLEVPIVEGGWIYKARTGGTGPHDAAASGVPGGAPEAWTGVVPLRVAAGAPEPAPGAEGVALPDSVRRILGS